MCRMYLLTERQMQRLEEVARRLEVDEMLGKAERHMLATEMAWVLAGVLYNQRLPADEPAEPVEAVEAAVAAVDGCIGVGN